MATETLTAEQALDEVLNRLVGGLEGIGWREILRAANTLRDPDNTPVRRGLRTTYGDLRRWAAPLLATEG